MPRKSPIGLLLVLLGTPGMIFTAWETGDKVPESRGPWICALLVIACLSALAAFCSERARQRVVAHRLLKKVSPEYKTAQWYHLVAAIVWFAPVALLPVPFAIAAFFAGYAAVAGFYMW